MKKRILSKHFIRYLNRIFLMPIFITLLALTASGQSLNAEKLYYRANSAIVIVSTPYGKGSGFLVDKNGHILTNHHVIEGAIENNLINVIFSDGSSYKVEVVDILDANYEDLALLKISPIPRKPVLPILPNGEARVGSEVVALGSALEYSFSIVTGNISSQSPFEGIDYILQFSAPVNPGNSGGPLLNRNGFVVGIVTSRREFSRDGRFIYGVSFATNSSVIRSFLRKNQVIYNNMPLISDVDLKKTEQLSDEERIAIQSARIAEIRQQQRIDSLRLEAELKELELIFYRRIQELENERIQDSIRIVREKIAAEARLLQEKQRLIEIQSLQRLNRPRRLALKFGGGAHYYYPDLNDSFTTFNSHMMSYKLNAMLAYRYNIIKSGNKERGTSFGLHLKYGLLNSTITNAYLQHHQMNPADYSVGETNNFSELELGWVFREWFRLTGGLGRQVFELGEASNTFNYYTATTGFIIRFGVIELDLTSTLLFGEFHSSPSSRFNATINFSVLLGYWDI